MDQSIKDVIKLQMEMETIQDKLEDLTGKSDSVKKALAFRQELNELLEKHGFSYDDLKEMLQIQSPKAKKSRKRPTYIYRNPHTGEAVHTKGGNHATIKEWKEKYGADKVESWKDVKPD